MKLIKKNKIELMAPVGSFSSLISACSAGADSVYFGVNFFSMRAGKNNFKISDLDKIRKVCQSYPRKPKMYLTLNTIIYDSEIKKLENLIKKIKGKIDAVICWDLAVIDLCNKYKVPFIVSTQASISNKKSALFYKKLGAKRIVLARELNLKQIKEIAKIKNLEVEVFIHGAMCVSISGRCFTSQFLFNKSANRGECFQPCRRSYTVIDDKYGHKLKVKNNKILSAKDLCALPFVEKLKNSGVCSFKIEGRNRDSRYVSYTVSVYREALDKKMTKKDISFLMKRLEKVYNRGFSSGFYLGKPTPKDFSEVENSSATTYKEYVGKINHLYPKAKTASIKLSKGLKINDKIAIIDENLGAKELTISSMEISNKKIKSAKKGDEIAIKFPFKVFKNAEVYRIKKRK